jgi:50S ribosomal subunit-associated GTPase HflX
MILQTSELSPSQKASLEETAGRKLLDGENIVCCGGTLKVASETARQNAALQMRYQLSLLDRSERRMSIEDCMAALMGDTEAELTA